MPTATPATKRPARKAAKRTSAKAATAKATSPAAAPRRKPPADGSAGEAASLRDLASRLGKLELAGLAGKLVEGWRADIAAIVAANRRSYAGLQAIVKRQTSQIKEAAGELQSVGKLMRAIGPKESVRNLDELALASLQLALADIRELADLAANSQREAFDLVHARVTHNIDAVQKLLRK